MSTNWLHDLLFGSNESQVKALEKLQQMDTEKFKEVFSALEALQKSQAGDIEQFKELLSALKELQKSQAGDVTQFQKIFSELGKKIDAEQFKKIQETVSENMKQITELSETVSGNTEQITELAEAFAEQEKVMVTCVIVSAVAAIAITSFVAFCIYQGIKCEKEKEKNLSNDTPSKKLGIDADGTEKLNNLQVNK